MLHKCGDKSFVFTGLGCNQRLRERLRFSHQIWISTNFIRQPDVNAEVFNLPFSVYCALMYL